MYSLIDWFVSATFKAGFLILLGSLAIFGTLLAAYTLFNAPVGAFLSGFGAVAAVLLLGKAIKA
jgi:hypothetical protein